MTTRTINAQTTLCVLIGNPIEHSLSPVIHNAAFSSIGMNWAYVACKVTDIQKALDGIRALNIRGASITIPHKVAAIRYLDTVDETARMIGSINTIVNNEGTLKGYNSDGEGAVQALIQSGHDPFGKSILILGTGGAARAVAFTLAMKSKPKNLTIMGIIPEELTTLNEDIKDKTPCVPNPLVWTDETVRQAVTACDICINCTPVGMSPKTNESPLPADLWARHHIVFDIVYNPLKTQLLRDAEGVGAAVIPGIEMFLNQAVIQFELWTGQQAPKNVMQKVLVKHFS
jgi:shikimate dehydrogenase